MFGPASTLSIVGGALLVIFGSLWPFLWISSFFDKRKIPTPEEARAAGSRPLISILAPARNEETVVDQMVIQMLEQTYDNWELFVIANNCTDTTADVARAAAGGDPRVVVYECKFDNGTKADALNRVLPKVNGEIVIQFDTDNTIEPHYLEEVTAAFADPDIHAVQTQIRAGNQREGLLAMLQDIEFLVYSEVFNRGRQAIGLGSSIGGTGFAVRTHIVREMGGWSRDLVEDFELHMRLVEKGIRVTYMRRVSVFDEKPLTWGALVRQRKRWVRGHLIISERRLGRGGLGFIDQIYLYSPVFVALSMSLLVLGYVFWLAPAALDGYAYFSPMLWLISLLVTATAVSAAIVKARESHMLWLVPIYLLVFGFHWMTVFIAAMWPTTWGSSKTIHGVKAEHGVLHWLGIDGRESLVHMLLVCSISALWVTPLALGIVKQQGEFLPVLHYASRSVAVAKADASPLPNGVRVTGVVHERDGSPIEDATVRLTSKGGLVSTTTTFADGTFVFMDLPAGPYDIDVSKSGYQAASTSFLLPSIGYVWVDATLAPAGGGIGAVPVPVPY